MHINYTEEVIVTTKNEELYNIIETLPEELSNKVLEYIDYLKYSEIMNTAPESVIIKNKKDLRQKIKNGMNDIKNGKVCSVEDAFSEIENAIV